MISFYKIVKETFKKFNINIHKKNINKCVEMYINIVKTEEYTIRLTFNYQMQFICIEIITNNNNWVILTSFDKFFKKYYCIYTFYLSLENIILSKNREKIIEFLKNFGFSISYDKFVNLMGV